MFTVEPCPMLECGDPVIHYAMQWNGKAVGVFKYEIHAKEIAAELVINGFTLERL